MTYSDESSQIDAILSNVDFQVEIMLRPVLEEAFSTGSVSATSWLDALDKLQANKKTALELHTFLSEHGIIIKDEFEDSEIDINLDLDMEKLLEEVDPEHPLALYITESHRYRSLSHSEQIQLGQQYNTGKLAKEQLEEMTNSGFPDESVIEEMKRLVELGKEAAHKLIKSNLRLVVSIASRYAAGSNLLDEVVQDGNMTLITALDKFDPSRNTKFSTYATVWVRQTIIKSLVAHGKSMQLPLHLYEQVTKIQKESAKYSEIHGFEPTDKELAGVLGISEAKVRSLRMFSRVPISLDAPLLNDPNNGIMLEIMTQSSEGVTDIASDLEKRILRQDLNRVLYALSPREEKVLRLRKGLEDGQNHTLEAIGKELHITRERVRQIEEEVLRKLRDNKYFQSLKDYL